MAAAPDYYEVLGIARDARPDEVRRAYDQWVEAFKKESTPPDERRESLLREAYEVLSDPRRRDAHDRELASRPAHVPRKARGPVPAIAALVAVAVVAGGAFFAFRGGPAGKAPKARSAEEILNAMSGSVAPLAIYDISGKSTPAGLAFVIGDKVMLANCQPMPPGVQLMVSVGPRQVPARVAVADEALGLCKLLTEGNVGEPLGVSSTPPVVGTKVYVASLGARGEVGVKEASVTKLIDEPQGKAIEASVPGQAGTHGAPLLDAQGKVVAVATLQANGSLLHRVIPAGWLERQPEKRPGS